MEREHLNPEMIVLKRADFDELINNLGTKINIDRNGNVLIYLYRRDEPVYIKRGFK